MQPAATEASVVCLEASHRRCEFLYCNRLQERNTYDSPINTDNTDSGIPPAEHLSTPGREYL